ncbi:hypothetical protein [Nostoc sp. FACHB-280]|uniref:hypothetical protein n=1 Tax=Nostoc sp. FACHB-280 TaxID=2692839 RepID=UPI00168B4DF5|nr:hypothetical protein [Nostoc sp. FACHB-280]MBD2495821.1 hypothetical protein [Nostoc sp. FACHB-280]
MGVASRYWQLVKIDGAGRRQVQEIIPAKEFFAEVFPEVTDKGEHSDIEIQLKLLQLSRDAPTDRYLLAQRCLLCFISWQIEQVCWQLEQNFGVIHGFTCADLLPYVLDDDGSLKPVNNYQCLSRKILQSFDPQQSSLKTWTHTKVKHDSEMNQFLLGCGVYLISDWAILNDTQPNQLQRILTAFYSLTLSEIQQAQKLLESYHTIYRSARLQQRARGIGGKCTTPTTEQLQQIALLLENKTGQIFRAETVMAKLQELAERLRQYRIYIRSAYLPTEPLDILNKDSHPVTKEILDNENEQLEFLKLYRIQFLACLEQALALVIQSRINQLQRKNADKAKQFLIALRLFHCQNLSMTEIAARLELRAQDAVTRLLKLKEFRSEVSQQLLNLLCKQVLELARNYSNIESLTILEQQIKIAINEQIEIVIIDAETQAQTAKNYIKTSLFNEKLCRYLDVMNEDI